jgi:hypothetical protein
MAERKRTFPILPAKWWWGLRDKLKQSVPNFVNAAYLAATLNIGEETAAKIALPAFRKIGIIDESGKPTERAIAWRDDEQYSNVCKDIKSEIYPEDILEALPSPKENRPAAERWFANRTKAGQSAVTKMVSFYQLLSDATLAKTKEITKSGGHISNEKKKVRRAGGINIPRQLERPTTSISASSKNPSLEGVTDIPLALQLLMRSLPQEGTHFPSARREQWLEMARATLAYLYPDEDAQSSHINQGEDNTKS